MFEICLCGNPQNCMPIIKNWIKDVLSIKCKIISKPNGAWSMWGLRHIYLKNFHPKLGKRSHLSQVNVFIVKHWKIKS